MLKTSVLKGGKFTLSAQLVKPNYLVCLCVYYYLEHLSQPCQKNCFQVSPDDVINRKISLHRYEKQEDLKERYIQRLQMKRRQTEMNVLRGKGYKGEKKEKKIYPITTARGEVKEISRREMLLHGDIFGILTGIFMQDGPFLILRLLLIINYQVYSEMHIFCTCKTAIALSLLVYRLCILTCTGEDEEDLEHEEQESRLQNVQQAVLSENFKKAGAIQLAG